MNCRERFLNTGRYKSVDRSIYGFWVGAWPETIERWKKEGYNPDIFPYKNEWDKILWKGGWFFPNPAFEHKVIEETETTVLYINYEGIIMRERKDNPQSSMPQFVKFPVETRQDFKKFFNERMQPDIAKRIGEDYASKLGEYKKRDYPLIVAADRWGGFFGPIRNLVGVERLSMLFYDDPVFLEEMMDAVADFIIAMMDKILEHTDIDLFNFWEDMAYKTAPLVSPELVKKFMYPRYKRVVDFLKSRGVEFIGLDSDGQITSLIPIWMDAGINFIYPFEVQAGMDVIKVREKFGKELRMFGGYDKRALIYGKKTIDAEFKRLDPLVREGGYILTPDHTFPPDVSYSNYCYFMEKWKQVL